MEKELVLTVRTLPLQVFRGIRFKSDFPDRFSGHLIYLREFYPHYEVSTGDEIDKAILNTLNGIFTKAETICNRVLIFDQQLTDCLAITKGGAEKKVIFHFIPTGDHSTLIQLHEAKSLKIESIELKTTFWLDKGDKRLDNIQDHIWVHASLEDIKAKFNTIKAI